MRARLLSPPRPSSLIISSYEEKEEEEVWEAGSYDLRCYDFESPTKNQPVTPATAQPRKGTPAPTDDDDDALMI